MRANWCVEQGKKIAHTFTYGKDLFPCFNDESDGMWAVEWKIAESMGLTA